MSLALWDSWELGGVDSSSQLLKSPQSEPLHPGPASHGVAMMLLGPGERGVLQTEPLATGKVCLFLFLASQPLYHWDFIFVRLFVCLCNWFLIATDLSLARV